MVNQHSKRINLQQRFVHDWGIGQEWRRIEQHVEPCAGLPFHVRFLASPGQVRYWFSPDGIHWTGAFPLHAKDVRNLQFVGIGFGNGMEKPGSIRLKRIVQRELAALSALAPADVRQRAVAEVEADDISAWLVAIAAQKPADVELEVWRRACAIQTLAAGCGEGLGRQLLECLLSDAAEVGTFQERLAVLQEAALLTNTWTSEADDRERLALFLAQYRRLARDAAQTGEARPFSLVRRAAMSAPLATDNMNRLFDKELIRDEIIRLAYGQQWPDLDRFLRELWCFAGSREYMMQVAPLEPWARAMIARRVPNSGESDVAVIKSTWRDPLVEEWSKEAFNVCAELYTAIASEAWADACRMITSVDPRRVSGLAPSSGDERLLVSLPTVVDSLMRKYPRLRATMADRLSSIGQVRLRQACAVGDAQTVEAIALQFHGTPAAAEAHRWLGDRALSGGKFAFAIAHYEQAGNVTGEVPDTDLGARMRLAAALMGEEYGQPVTAPVHVGDTVMAVAEFEKMVADLRSSRAGNSLRAVGRGESSAAWEKPPDAAEFRFRETGRFDAVVGAEPRHDPRGIRDREIHPIDRQLSAVVADGALYVNSRFQVAAYDLNSGQRKWISQLVPGPRANPVDWPLIPMRPFVTAGRVYARQLAGKSPAIVCLDRSHGKNIWTYHDPQSGVVVSDPIAARGRLMAFVTRTAAAETDTLQLVVLDPGDGRVVETRPIVNLRDSWRKTSVCQVLPLGDQLVAVLGGAVLSLDHAGNVRWVRRQLQMPPDDDYLWIRQDHQVPLFHDSKVYVTCPGVRTIDCIDPQTGGLQFRRVMPFLERYLGVAAGKLIVQSRDAIEALDPATGETLWRHETRDPLPAYLCGPSVIYTRRYTSAPAKNLRAPELVWLEPETGRELAAIPVPQMSDDWPRFAALVPHGKRLWALFGRGDRRPRAVGELTPTGEATRQPSPQGCSDPWLVHLPPELHAGAARVLPGWTVLSGQGGARSGYLAEINGEKDVFGAISRVDCPVVLVRDIQIPSHGRPRLKGRLWVQHGRVLEIEVRFGGKLVSSLEKPEGQASQWMNLEVDLAAQKGRHAALSLHVRFLRGGEEANIFWKSLELMN
jgi:outer membrane protein assembly factor BamB